MSARPYKVTWDCGYWETFATFPEALALYRERTGATIINLDGYDCDYDEDGFHCCDDGLTDEEREAME